MSKPEPAEDFTIAQQHAPNTRTGMRSAGWIALIILVGGLSYGAGHHISTDSIAEAATDSRLSMIPSVRTVTAHQLKGGVALDLPGSIEFVRDIGNSGARVGLYFTTFRRHRDAGEKGRCACDHPLPRT